jgi:hypothetical protein
VSNFLKSTPFETTFDGDKVTCRFKPIRQGDSLRIFGLINADGKIMKQDALPVYSEIVPQYVEDFAGLRTSDGTAVELVDVTRHTYFSELLLEMGTALQKTGRAPDPKAPALQPGDTSAA